MKQGVYIIFTVVFFLFIGQYGYAQQKVIQLYGVVKASDSSALPGASIFVKGSDRGTIANNMGIYSIAVSPGDKIEFSFIGYKKATVQIPLQLNSDYFLSSPTLIADTSFLPTTIVTALPSPIHFKRMFLEAPILRTKADIARDNINIKRLLQEMRYLPQDAQSIYNMHARERVLRGAQRGLVPSSGLFNPFAWVDFIRSLKEGGRK